MTSAGNVPAADAGLQGAVYTPAWRVVIAALRAFSRASLLLVMAAVLFADGPTPEVLLPTVTVLAALPGIAAGLLERAFAARLTVGATHLVVHGRGRRIEIPRDAIAGAVPWRLPLPAAGLWLRLRSGRRIAVALADPGSLRARLGFDAQREHPIIRWAAARARRAPSRWSHPLVKFPLFGLLPSAILFRAHQWIAYGGTLGQYHLLGLRAYLTTFAIYWATVTIYLVLWANLLRLLAEAGTLVAAHVAPDRAPSVRRAAELACGLLYWAGVPVVLLLRFLP